MSVRHLRLDRWPLALAAIAAFAAVLLLPFLESPGVWEPQERQALDRIAPPQAIEAERAIQQLQQTIATIPDLTRFDPDRRQPPQVPPDSCVRAQPRDAVGRSLTYRAMRFGRDEIDDSDWGRRLPLALLGLLTVLATTGLAMRLGGARAGVVTGLVLLAMPLLALQSRLLTSELGTACGAALILYGLVALARPCRRHGIGILALDALLSATALAAGVAIGFLGGGALLGLVVPIGAFAAAGALGVSLVRAARGGDRIGPHVLALVATLVAVGLVGLLAYQIYDLREPYPGILPPARQVLGKAIVAEGCWSWALGAMWRPEDDVRYIFDSAFEQIGYGTFPWGVLAPIAMVALLRDTRAEQRWAGALALAWAGGAWIATEAFQRHVGFTVWSGFPALALAVGVWLDGVLDRRDQMPDEPQRSAPPAGEPQRSAPPAGDNVVRPGAGPLIGLYFLLAVLVLGKDMYSFAEKVTSLTVGNDTVQFPAMAKLWFVPAKIVPFAVGALGALAMAVAFGARARHRVALACAAVAFGATALLAAFWVHAWHPTLSRHLSSKGMFETYRALRMPGDDLIIMGDLGNAPRAYADATPVAPPPPPPPPATPGQEQPPPPQPPAAAPGLYRLESAASRDQIVAALKRPHRVFAIAPQTEICSLHREIGEKPYFVVDDRNARNYLLSNSIAGTVDKNPLATMIVHEEPKNIPRRPPARIVWDGKIELLGWDLPPRAAGGRKFEMVVYYKILQPVGGNWKSLVHFDGQGRAGNGDHEPIRARCPTSTWQPGDYIIDRFTAAAGGGAYPSGPVEVWIGFFTGSAPSFTNMKLSEAPSAMRDPTSPNGEHDRVKITGMILD